jgi:hypothetical protein
MAEVKCREKNCDGVVEQGICTVCGARFSVHDLADDFDETERQAIVESVRQLLEPRDVAPNRQGLLTASHKLKKIFPYNFEAWRLHADLLLTAITQLETRQLQPDPSFTLFTIPFREDDLRDAAEAALRECAHFADSDEKRIALVDEANRIRRLTWT